MIFRVRLFTIRTNNVKLIKFLSSLQEGELNTEIACVIAVFRHCDLKVTRGHIKSKTSKNCRKLHFIPTLAKHLNSNRKHLLR